eukprot:6488961-Amphidinium_carterae.1
MMTCTHTQNWSETAKAIIRNQAGADCLGRIQCVLLEHSASLASATETVVNKKEMRCIGLNSLGWQREARLACSRCCSLLVAMFSVRQTTNPLHLQTQPGSQHLHALSHRSSESTSDEPGRSRQAEKGARHVPWL